MKLLRKLRGPAALMAVVLSLTALVLGGIVMTGGLHGSQFTINTTNGQNFVGHNSDYEVTATLPASLADEVIIPMTFVFRDGGQLADAALVYQGEQPLPWSMFGNRVTFTMQAIGRPGDTSDVMLIRVPSALANEILAAPRGTDNQLRWNTVEMSEYFPYYAYPAYDRLEIVGA